VEAFVDVIVVVRGGWLVAGSSICNLSVLVDQVFVVGSFRSIGFAAVVDPSEF
jgi:hypothetical protein